jgi:menaquinone-dependent protoporphyrinogen oxidase
MKVLISVASRHGATLEIAEVIRNELIASSIDVDVIAPERVTDVSNYDAIVIGSSVYAGRWLAPARELIDRQLAQLLEKPVWLFSSGPLGSPPKPSQPPVDALELAHRTNALDHQMFEGRIDRELLGFGERAVARVVGAPSGDFRPWYAIAEWARRIAASATGEEQVPVGAGPARVTANA